MNLVFKYFTKIFIFIICTYILRKINCLVDKYFTKSFSKYINESIYKNIYNNQTFPSRVEAFYQAKNFLNNCLQENYIHKQEFTLAENIRISAVIPLYNSSQFIGKTIKSIQNQSTKDIEIILINDFSQDNTLSIIEKLKEEDPRIKIINNKKNMGILYSRSVGALLSKGEYIFPLDNDDMFLDEEVFNEIFNIANGSNIDIVEFRGIFQIYTNNNILNETTINDTKFQDHKSNLVLFQPELGNYPLKEGRTTDELFNDVYLWAKCIKTYLYKQAISKLGERRISRYVLIFEDIYVNYVLFNIANNFKFIDRYGLFRIKREESASKIWGEYNELNRSLLYLVDIVLEFSRNLIQSQNIIIFIVIHLLNREKILETLKRKESDKQMFYSCINRILCSKYFSIQSKLKLKVMINRKLSPFNFRFHRRICFQSKF